ncbi:outer membrane beta-barrel protein [Flavitalea flava]
MLRKIAGLFILCFCSQASRAQNLFSIRGKVQDSSSRAFLDGATLIMVHLPDTTDLQFQVNRKNGFLFKDLKPGSYLMLASHLGYRTDTFTIKLDKSAVTETVKNILLVPTSTGLAEVVVRATIPPAIVHNDTIAFNAGAYALRPNSTVEDLLRRLPGVEVDKDGNVTMQGKKVDKIYLDGKEFFLGDLKTGTRNLPSDIVAQIEAYDTQTDRGKLTGIKDRTGTKTINVKLKKDRKRGYFGNIYGGIGNDKGENDAYSVGGSITNLGGSRWISATANANNISNQFTGTDTRTSFRPSGRQTMGSAQLNLREEVGKKLSYSVAAGYNSVLSKTAQTSTKQTFLADSSLVESRSGYSSNDMHSGNANAFATYKIDSFNLLEYRGSFSQNNMTSVYGDTVSILTSKPADAYTSNAGRSVNSNDSRNINLSNDLEYRRNFKKQGRLFLIGLNHSVTNQRQPASTYSLVDNFDSTANRLQQKIINQQSNQTGSGNNYGLSVTYTEPLAAHQVLDLNYSVNSSSSRSDKNSFDYDSTTGNYDKADTTTSNHFQARNTVHRLGVGYNLVNGKFQYQLGVAAQFTNLDNNNYTLHSHLVQHFTNWYPRASLLYALGQGRNLNLSYSGNSTAPSIDQLQPLPDITNPFFVRVGNPDLKQQFDHNLGVNYAQFNQENYTNLQASLSGNYTENKITTATTILSGGVQQLQFVNTSGNYSLNANVDYGFPLGKPGTGLSHSGNGNISMHGRYGRDLSLLNGGENITNNMGWGSQLRIGYHLKDKLYIDGVAAIDYNGARYSINSNPNSNSWVSHYDLDAAWRLPGGLSLSSNYTLQVTGKQAGLSARAVSLWNASIAKSLFHQENWKLRLSAYDLLNNSTSYTQFVGLNFIQTSSSNLPGRLFLLSLAYNFRKFPVKKA